VKKSNGPKCVECGKRLQHYSGDSVLHSDGTKTTEPGSVGRGIHGNGKFCSHTCGFAWAVRWASRLMFWR